MKKLYLKLCLSLMFGAMMLPARAQYVKTFQATDPSGAVVQSEVKDIKALPGTGEVCILEALNYMSGGTLFNSGISLKKLDASGNVMFHVTYPQSDVYPYSLQLAPQGDYIVVGFALDGTGIRQPFAARFDAAGNFIWMHTYRSNTGTYFWALPSVFYKVSITEVLDDDFESYIITAPGEQIIPNTYNQDCYINALRIDGHGTPLWNRKYAYRGGPAPYNAIENGPSTIAYGNDGSGGKYFIAGPSRYWDLTGNHDDAFYMSIDRNGNIVDPYTRFMVPGYTWGNDALYDAGSQEFIMSYTLGDNNLAGFPTASEIAVSRFGFSGLSHNRTDYYYTKDATENYAMGIDQNTTKTGYILSTWISGNLPVYIYPSNAGILEIDPPSGAVNHWHRYNVRTEVYPGVGIVSAFDGSSGKEFYVTACQPHIPPSTSMYDYSRVISTDNGGNTCGAFNEAILTQSYTPVLNPEFYIDFVCDDRFVPVLLNPEYPRLTETTCDPWSNPEIYIVAKDPADNTGIRVYPTELTGENHILTLAINSVQETTMKAELYSMEGKKIDSGTFTLHEGDNQLSWTVDVAVPGAYLVKTSSTNGRLNSITRIVKY